MVQYVYDAWGNCTISTTSNQTLAQINPFRYRGYFYDVETGLYFLKTRYYDPTIGRFINIDSINYVDPESINGLNLYAYCGNNPIMYIDESGHLPKWLGTTLKILAGVAIVAGLAVASVATGGTVSVILAGAAIGAAAGGVGAGVSTVVSGGDIHDFADSFLMGTTTGAISGAVAASPLSVGWQMGINAAISVGNYVGTQLLSENKITLGGLIFNGLVGAASGYIGQSGWMQGQKTGAFIAFKGQNALKHVFGMVGTETLLRMTLPPFIIGGIGGGLYGRLSSFFNADGDFIGF